MACQLVSQCSQSVSHSVSYFGLGAASRSCNNRAAEGRTEAAPRAGAGGRVGSKSLLALAAAARKRSIRGLSVLHSYHKLLHPSSVVVREAVKWDLNHDVAVVVQLI